MSAGEIVFGLGISLGLTLAIETVFAAVFCRRVSDIVLSVLANIATNPIVNAVHLLLCFGYGWPRFPVVLALEIFAVLAEAGLYRHCGRDFRRPLLFSLSANALSYSFGLVFNLI